MERVPIVDFEQDIKAYFDEYQRAISAVLCSGQFINGPSVQKFEEKICEFLNCKYAVALNSGTDALVIALRALGIGPGDEVITTSFSFFATAEAISVVGAVPLFVDIDPLSFNIDPSKIADKISSKTKAIIVVHVFGESVDFEPVLEISKKFGLKIVEDVAQAFGSKWLDKSLGTIGHVGALSFFPTKNLGAFGDGGMVVSNSSEISHLATMLRQHGAKKKYQNEMIGYNSRLDTLQAAILLEKLNRFEESAANRIKRAKIYCDYLAPLEGKIRLPKSAPYSSPVYHQFTIRVCDQKRDELKIYLQDQGIETGIYYPTPIHLLKPYQGYNLSLPQTERACSEVLSLPFWPEMSLSVQERVCHAIIGFFRTR